MTDTVASSRTSGGALISRHIVLIAILLVVLILCLGLFAHNTRVTEASASDQPAAKKVPASPNCSPNWVVVASPNQPTSDNALTAVAVAGPNDVWAVGSYHVSDNYSTLIEHWNGSTWSVVSSPNPGGGGILNGVAAAGPNDVWAVGEYVGSTSLQTLIEHWNGSAWSVVSSPSPDTNYNNLNGVAAAGSNDVWAVGYYGAALTLVEHWNGSAWSVVSSPSPGTGNASLQGVAAAGPNDVWAVGAYYNGSHYLTLIEHWNGSAWSVVSSPSPGTTTNHLQGVAAAGPNDVWAVGFYIGITNAQTLIEHWNGSAWSVVSSPSPGLGPNNLEGVAAAGPNDVWAVGKYYNGSADLTLVEHWNGSAWSVVSSPGPGLGSNNLQGVAAAGPNDVWAVGAYAGSASLQTLIERYNPCGGNPTATSMPATSPTPGPPTATPTPCTAGVFSDVPSGSTYYPYVTCLASRSIVGGYSDCTFRPGNPVTRGQLSKIVSLAANYTENHTEQTFQDVAPGSTFHLYVERLASRNIINGYVCGGVGEPCVGPGNKPYFRTNANVTRGQTSKIVAIAKGLPAPTPGQQTFQDVPTSSTFWQWIEELSTAGAIGGYPCGGTGEPCGSGNKPYFRAANNVTRGQSSKIVANTFYPGCSTQK